MRILSAASLVLWAGAILLLSEVRWFARPRLADRLRPYAPPGASTPPRQGLLSVESFRDLVAPVSRAIGERLARLFGVGEELALRLERVHSTHDVTSFRVHQMSRMAASMVAGALVAVALRPPPVVSLLLLLGAPLLAFLVIEQQVAVESARRQRRVFLELPVVVEQLATLLAAGYSLGSAINRVASRGSGACAADLARVAGRVRQGLSDVDALREWAAVTSVPAHDRLVPILALDRESGDLGRLLAEEAKAIRRDVQRELIETMERRGQQVWIPVTVATLVPGVVFLAIPFIEALRLFAS